MEKIKKFMQSDIGKIAISVLVTATVTSIIVTLRSTVDNINTVPALVRSVDALASDKVDKEEFERVVLGMAKDIENNSKNNCTIYEILVGKRGLGCE